MLKLGVNVDHVATLREARYRGLPAGEPDLVAAIRVCEAAGAHGITIHLREDRRHIQDRDVFAAHQAVKTRLNLEVANVAEIVEIALRARPEIVCVVPERRQEVTTEGGLDAVTFWESLRESCARLNAGGIDVSLFIAPDLPQVEAAAKIGAQFIELHTGAYAEAFGRADRRHEEILRLRRAAERAHELGLKLNAGHGLNVENVRPLLALPHLVELNIGHSIVSRSIFIGLGAAVREMLDAMESR